MCLFISNKKSINVIIIIVVIIIVSCHHYRCHHYPCHHYLCHHYLCHHYLCHHCCGDQIEATDKIHCCSHMSTCAHIEQWQVGREHQFKLRVAKFQSRSYSYFLKDYQDFMEYDHIFLFNGVIRTWWSNIRWGAI